MTIAQLQLLIWIGVVFGGIDHLLFATNFAPVLGWPALTDHVMQCPNERLYVQRGAEDAFRDTAMHLAAERQNALENSTWTCN